MFTAAFYNNKDRAFKPDVGLYEDDANPRRGGNPSWFGGKFMLREEDVSEGRFIKVKPYVTPYRLINVKLKQFKEEFLNKIRLKFGPTP